MFKIDWLRSFVAVADQGSFTLAARQLELSTMALSKHLSQLEAELDEPLLKRSTRSLQLTEFGQAFLARAEHLLREQDALAEWVQSRHSEPSGVLRVMGVEMALRTTVLPWVAEFRQRYPRIELEIDIANELIDPNRQTFDLVWGTGRYLGDRYPGLIRRRLLNADYGVFASPNYLARFGTPQHPRELDRHQLIGQLHDEPNNFLVIRDAGAGTDLLPVCYMTAPVKASLGHLQLCVSGLGLINASANLPEVQAAVADGRLVPVLRDYWFEAMDLYFYTHQVRQRQAKVDAFIDFFWPKAELLG